MLTMGECLKKYREKAGYTQDDVAEELDATSYTVKMWECNRNVPSLFNVWHLADLYNVSIDELVGRTQKEEE